ncbi:MAG: GLUG motif-containing protein, partial [Planctomycetota bacterium]
MGRSSDETISNCCARGTVTGEQNIGGLVGYNRRIVENCYATGGITGEDRVGGLVGANTWPGKIVHCYSVGAVTGTTDVGGLAGYNDEAVIKTSFWDVQTSGQNEMCGRERLGIGCDNAGGKTTAGMQRKNTFLDADWDFTSAGGNGTDGIWIICDGLGYPEFARQFVTGDFDGDNRVDLADFAFFAERWLSEDIGFLWCRGADLTGDREVGFEDLQVFADNWLADRVAGSSLTVYLVLDDFESYNDRDPADPESNRIFDAWTDGYDNPATNGAIVGYDTRPFTERQIVHGGRQSMPYSYNALFKFAKAELMLNPPQNWAAEKAEVLSLWFRGDSSNAPVPMSVILNGSSAVYHDNPDATQLETWTRWNIDLEAFRGVDLANVNSIAICFGDQSGTVP